LIIDQKKKIHTSESRPSRTFCTVILHRQQNKKNHPHYAYHQTKKMSRQSSASSSSSSSAHDPTPKPESEVDGRPTFVVTFGAACRGSEQKKGRRHRRGTQDDIDPSANGGGGSNDTDRAQKALGTKRAHCRDSVSEASETKRVVEPESRGRAHPKAKKLKATRESASRKPRKKPDVDQKSPAPPKPFGTSWRWVVEFRHLGWWLSDGDVHRALDDESCTASNSVVLSSDCALFVGKVALRHRALADGHITLAELDPQNTVPHMQVRPDASRRSVANYRSLQGRRFLVDDSTITADRDLIKLELAPKLHYTLLFAPGLASRTNLRVLLWETLALLSKRPELIQHYVKAAASDFGKRAAAWWTFCARCRRDASSSAPDNVSVPAYPDDVLPPPDWMPEEKEDTSQFDGLRVSAIGLVMESGSDSPSAIPTSSGASEPDDVADDDDGVAV
jgi:hypothetical protein